MSEFASDVGPTAEAIVTDTRRVTPNETDEVRQLRLRVLDPAFRVAEGQSIGVVVPGPHPFGNRYHLRRYSIANAPELPGINGADLEILVRRCFYIDEVSGERYPGIASNFLCDAEAGARLTLSGPYRSPFSVPFDPESNLLMVGTGTGIAPFRAFVRHIYERRHDWRGQVRVYYGGRSGLDLMYANDEGDDLANYYDAETFKAFKAVAARSTMSSSQALEGGLRENSEDAWELIQQPNTYVFLAGLEKIAQVFDRVMAGRAGSSAVWQDLKQKMIEDKRWSELIYN